jgi:hypothetical protein
MDILSGPSSSPAAICVYARLGSFKRQVEPTRVSCQQKVMPMLVREDQPCRKPIARTTWEVSCVQPK